MNQQQWDDLTQAVGAMLKDVDVTSAKLKYMADLSLLAKLRERLVALPSGLAATDSRIRVRSGAETDRLPAQH